jgi:3-oxoacyl-[acyl-carrier protein] reductase
MMSRKFGRIVNITSGAVKAPIDVLGLSNGARSGLTGFVAGLSRKTVRDNVTINGLLPGPFATDRMAGVAAGQAKAAGVSAEEILKKRAAENPAGRFGDPEEFGLACAFLCGAKAGFITGQNILLDGGAYPGTM